MSGTEGKQEGNRVHDLRGRGGKEGELKGTSEERVRRTRLAQLKHSDYAEYWKRGGREENPNKRVAGDQGEEEEHGEKGGEATKLREEEGKKDEEEGDNLNADNQIGARGRAEGKKAEK